MSQLPHGLVSFGPNANCTLDTCPIEASILQYRPSVPANVIFIVVFALAMLVHIFQGIRTGSWGFMVNMVCGCILEIAGYVGRVLLHGNPFIFSGFLMQIVCITVAPVFYCSAIYVVLSQVVNYTDRSVSRFSPRLFYWMFIPADIVSLVLQATGGGLSCVGNTKNDIQVGVNISMAGLIFQVVTLTLFCIMFGDYIYLGWGSPGRHKLQCLKGFLACLFTATLLVLLRCCYRVVELHAGYFSELFRDEPLFVALESAVMCCAVIFLNLGHPGSALNDGREELLSIDEEELITK
ncbi:RTA1-domain-containing protein [Aspergillus steynii IBT 23096]|uniref:RTA1-domain-containing protein n=1 Tax=Aspergillus steynii IBT 23096 TaxID=1392250 RepID=A0A2I2G790_9EURO|nr:RTA1-domain-containing protein [Aspergillus steynii IBT 23096]PLB48744.1 RTA1-domain-containing protein [Aspergillus steynii IBT 23096]